MEIALKNIMEALVVQKLDEVIYQLDCCQCDQCRMDIVSYALNRLPPRYYDTKAGEVFSKLDNVSLQCETDILAVLVQAAQIVKEHPRHGQRD